MTKKTSSANSESVTEYLCGRIFGHKYRAQELRFYGLLDSTGKVYEICTRCGKRNFLGWKHSLSDKDYISVEDDGTPWYDVTPFK